MLTWDESISQIEASQGSPTIRSGVRWFWIRRLPVVVTGFSGAGKTELWRHLTLKPAEDRISSGPDEGYYFRAKKRSTLALITIPGQLSNKSTILSDKYMDRSAKVHGVIFVASFGYNFIWPGLQAEAVASSLRPYSLPSLTKRNKDQELDSFNEICTFISEKWSRSPKVNRPKWLLILCNKIDLYWDETDAAHKYYRLGSGDFGRAAAPLVEKLAGGGFRYHVLPIAIQPRNYLFDSTNGSFKRESTLSEAQGDASMNLLVDTLEELCGPQQ
jgi:hypothetical protein